MNWDVIAGKWKQVAGTARAKWGELTDDELDQVAGQRDRLEGLLQEKYGWTKERVDSEIDAWSRSVHD